VAASLARAGHEVRFLNGAFLSHQAILTSWPRGGHRWVGIYATTFGWPGAERTGRGGQGAPPRNVRVRRGPYPIAVQERCLERENALDAVVTGEGERTSVEMVEGWSGARASTAWRASSSARPESSG